MLCITNMNVKQAQFASKYVGNAALLIVFASIYCPALIQFSKQARTSAHTISFGAHFLYFLHSHFCRIPQTFEASGNLLEAGEYTAFVAFQPQA